ncbi:MAG: nucleoside recognition domain-containing protein [Candidatus Zixiibacteriota bacterium]
MSMMDIAKEIALGLGGLMLKIFLIVLPLLMALEWARSRRWFTRAIDATQSVFRPIGFRPSALFPLITGIIFGIAYGAGVLIPQARSGEIDRQQVFLITAFLGVCHAIIEDTLLFVALGANGGMIVLTRFVAALVIVFFLSKLPWPAATITTGDIRP